MDDVFDPDAPCPGLASRSDIVGWIEVLVYLATSDMEFEQAQRRRQEGSRAEGTTDCTATIRGTWPQGLLRASATALPGRRRPSGARPRREPAVGPGTGPAKPGSTEAALA